MRLFLPMASIEESVKILSTKDLLQSRGECKYLIEGILRHKKLISLKPNRKIKQTIFWNGGDPYIQELQRFFKVCCTEINKRNNSMSKNTMSIKRLMKISENLIITQQGQLEIPENKIIQDRQYLYHKSPQYYSQFWNNEGQLEGVKEDND